MYDSALVERFERMVDRSGEHHLWTGAIRPGRGTGRLKVDGRQLTAQRVAWELANGVVPEGAVVLSCRQEPACVRIDHLHLAVSKAARSQQRTRPTSRARKGSGSMRELSTGTWKLSATLPRAEGVRPRRVHKTVRGIKNKQEAAEALAAFVTEVHDGGPPASDDLYNLTTDEAIERFLDHLRDDKGREEKTASGYRQIHYHWFAAEIGARRVRDVDLASLDRCFGRMRRAGLSRSRMNQARSLYAPFFRWAQARGMTRRNPMATFELPTSQHVSTERTPPEVEELSVLLSEATVLIPDVAPVLVLGAVTGMRRGELVGVRRSRVNWRHGLITVDVATDGTRVKATKTRKPRAFSVDAETIAMLGRVCEDQDRLAAAAGVAMVDDPFLFSLKADGSEHMQADYVTKSVAILKSHLGIEEKRPATVALEDEALRLFRQPPRPRPAGMTGPKPRGGLSYREIAQQLGRSERWVALAIASAERREDARRRGAALDFDGSVLALRKFTSTELLDAGFNISMVAQRQGHGTQVLAKHYSRMRRSADRKAAAHLGNVVHGGRRR